MPRSMSFSKTTEQVRDRSKTVTRRTGWSFLKPGDRLWAVVKGMGLKKGEKVERITLIEVVSVRAEKLSAIDRADVIAEGFPDMSPAEFVAMFCKHMGCISVSMVNRVEFKYVECQWCEQIAGELGTHSPQNQPLGDLEQCELCGKLVCPVCLCERDCCGGGS